jgi:F-type H+-transporting ATPase subunit b
MTFDWTTFGLEVLNFLVLVWLLKRFFYQPVMATIEARRAENAKLIEDARTLRREAEALKDAYQTRLAAVDQDAQAARLKLDEEMAGERARRVAALTADMAEERKRREAIEARQRSESEVALERQALAIAARFASRLLERVAGPELDAKLVDLALHDLASLPAEGLETLRVALQDPGVKVRVVTAYPLDTARRGAIIEALTRLAGRTMAPDFTQDAMLKAGICIMAGAWVLMANLRDELGFFTEAIEHGR